MFFKLALILATVLNVARFGDAASAPFITKCKALDSDCITANAVKAIPLFSDGLEEFGVEKLDPLTFDQIDASKPNLKFVLNDVHLTGLKHCKPEFIRRDPANSKIFMKLDCPVECVAKYLLSGNLLTINIEGEGPMNVKAHLVVDVDGDIVEQTGKDDKKHFNVNKFTYTYDFAKKSQVQFENLFPDNEILRQAANDLMKENGNEVVKEIGGPLIHASVTKVFKNVNNFFKECPIEELALD